MDLKKMTDKQLAKEIIAKKIENKKNDMFIKEGLEELRNRGIQDITTRNGMIYSVAESVKNVLDNEKIKVFLGKKIKDFQTTKIVEEHYAVKPIGCK